MPNAWTVRAGCRRTAFTLLEALVVAGIMSMLLAMLVPSFGRARESARRTVCVAHLKHIGAGLFTYALEQDDYGPQVMRRAGSTSPRTLLSRSGRYVNLGLLIGTGIAKDPGVFYCPSQRKFSFGSNPKMIPRATVAGSYAYAVHVPASQSPRLAADRHLALASDDFVARIGTRTGVGRYAHRVGYNVLYTDGSVNWYADPDESISQRAVRWDNERDDITYDTLYETSVTAPVNAYGDALDIFRAWWSFCYNRPDPF